MSWLQDPIAAPDPAAEAAARARQGQLTKPPGSRGLLEVLAVRLAALQCRPQPRVDEVRIVIFAADHGVAAEGVSAFPQAVTLEMIRNFARGGAAISVLARELGATLEVVNLGTVAHADAMSGVIDRRLGPGSANFVSEPAMDKATLRAAMDAGAEAVDRALADGAELFVGGEMGIANTTAATAVAAALLELAPIELAGPGTGLPPERVRHKAAIIERAIALHRPVPSDPEHVLRCLGGFELAALAGSYLRAAQQRLPVLVDGFIATAAALAATRLRPELRPWLMFGHRSTEPGHGKLLAALDAEPILALDMRLGEASGAAMAVHILRSACTLHNQMATFAEAGVSNKDSN